MSFFPIILVLFCYFLHKMCIEKEVSPWGYLGGFVTGFLLIIGAAYAGCLYFYGVNLMHDPDAQKKMETMAPFAMMFQFLLFIFFRKRIENIPDYHDEDDDNSPTEGGKKDLSYFR
jgi:hypothetical protein